MGVNLTIAKKGLILISIPFLFQLAFSWLIAEMHWSNAAAQRSSSHSKEVRTQAETVLRKLLDAETGIRGFAVTSDPVFTEPYHWAMRDVPEAMAELQRLVSDNPDQEARAKIIAAKASQIMAKHAEDERVIASGARDQTVARTAEGKRQMDDIRQEIDAFLQQEQGLEEARGLALEGSRQRLNALLVAGVAVSVLCTIALGFVFSRGITHRLATLIGNAERLARGKELAPPIAGNDEITRLDRAFRDSALELARSAEVLRKQTGILQSILESMGDGVVVADEKGKFLVFNPAAEQILGIGQTDEPPEAWTKRYGLYLADGVTPYPASEIPLARAMRGEPVNQAELFVRHAAMPQGTWVSVTARPLRDKAGVPGGGVVVFRDVSERKRSEAEIRKLNEDLERRVSERTGELVEANRQLSQKNQDNEMFVYSVSHDLRSPLVNLEGFSRELTTVSQDLRSLLTDDHLQPAMRERGLALLDGDMAEAIRFIQTGVVRMSNIIDALLRLSRSGRVVYEWQRVDVDALVARIITSMSTTIAERAATITVGKLPPIWGDPTAVEQIFANLIGNALNYLDPKRPGVIEVGSDNMAGAGESTGSVALHTYYVKDNGLGIPEAYKAKVFQAFQRLHPDVAKGEGVGLALVRRIVERHGGRIWLESTVGIRTTFFVTLKAPPVNGAANDFPEHGMDAKEKEDATWQRSSLSFC